MGRMPVDPVYSPAEDSYLLAEHVEKLVAGRVLDIGTGSGIQAVTAAKKREVTEVVAVDINPGALFVAAERAKREGVNEKIHFIESDLFSSVKGRFDWILFNPPYLPSEGELSDPTWDGGPTGVEVIERFLADAPAFLAPEGFMLLLYSSETELKGDYGYKWLILEKRRVFFETLICARLKINLS